MAQADDKKKGLGDLLKDADKPAPVKKTTLKGKLVRFIYFLF